MYCPACRSTYPHGWKRCPTDEAQLLRGPVVGKYQIDRLIGAGGMGAVYRAVNPDTASAVALKLLHGGSAGMEAARTRFQREAAAVAALKTRHVVSIFDFGADDDGTMYLVMELLLGHTLRREIAAPPAAMPLPRVNLVFEGALRGLGAAHRAGIVHRDLKPENVFIADTDDGEVAKLLDFGIARTAGGSTLTQSGALMGTPAYMAPEQVAGNRGEIGAWSDVYAMGVMLYEMLSGGSPFVADSMTEVLRKVLAREFPPLRSVRTGLPEGCYQLCERALADDIGARYPHADALREAWTEAWAKAPAELRDATVPRFRGRAGGNRDQASAPPGTVQAAPTPGGHRSRGRTPSEIAADAALAPTADPVTGEAGPGGRRGGDHASSSARRRLAVGLGALAVAGVAVVVLIGGSRGRGRSPGAVADDGGVADAVSGPGPIDAGAPPGMVRLPGGGFTMGADPTLAARYPNALARQSTEVAPFLIDRLEMTALAVRTALDLPPRTGDGPDLPARNVTWTEADAACSALGKRLPTEAEWEFAAQRGPLAPADALLKGPAITGPAAVGTHPGDCTPDGVCDLLGNVMEWTSDGDARARIARGASYLVAAHAEWFASIHARARAAPDNPDPEIGLRCAADAR